MKKRITYEESRILITNERILSLTQNGTDILKNISTVFEEWYHILYEGMSKDDIACMKRLTGKMAVNIANHMD